MEELQQLNSGGSQSVTPLDTQSHQHLSNRVRQRGPFPPNTSLSQWGWVALGTMITLSTVTLLYSKPLKSSRLRFAVSSLGVVGVGICVWKVGNPNAPSLQIAELSPAQWGWVALGTVKALATVILFRNKPFTNSRLSFVMLSFGTLGVGICAWKVVKPDISSLKILGFSHPPLSPKRELKDLKKREELINKMQGFFSNFYEKIIFESQENSSLIESRKELSAVIGRYTALQINEQLSQLTSPSFPFNLMGNENYLIDLIDQLADENNFIRIGFEEFMKDLMLYFNPHKNRVNKRENFLGQSIPRLEKLFATVRQEDGELKGGKFQAILGKLNQKPEVWAPVEVFSLRNRHQLEVDWWAEHLTARLGLAVAFDGDKKEDLAKRVVLPLAMPSIARGLAEAIVGIGEYLTSEKGLDQLFGLVLDAMEPKSPPLPKKQNVSQGLPNLLSKKEEEMIVHGAQAFLNHACQANLLRNVSGWVTRPFAKVTGKGAALTVEGNVIPPVNEFMNSLFTQEGDQQVLNPKFIQPLIEEQIKELTTPLSEEGKKQVAEATKKRHLAIEEFFKNEEALLGGLLPLSSGIGWVRKLLQKYPEVGRLLVYRLSFDFLDSFVLPFAPLEEEEN
ncbi:MAG: hypothetical protein JSR80_07395 [Verrucomicrobia bacterium]|nr:hypothetical protein [Verrucomicrobiota bacterium]